MHQRRTVFKEFSKTVSFRDSSIEGDNYVSYRRQSPEKGVEFEVLVHQEFTRWLLTIHGQFLVLQICFESVELCIYRVGWIKYFFKHVCNGSDRVTIEIVRAPTDGQNESLSKEVLTIDEIRHYQDARYVSASESACRLFSFPVVEHGLSVERLEFHLNFHHTVYYKEGEHENAKTLGKEKPTKLVAYFAANHKYKNAKCILYVDFPI